MNLHELEEKILYTTAGNPLNSDLLRKIREVMEINHEIMQFLNSGVVDFSNGVDIAGMDEGRVIAKQMIENWEKRIKEIEG